MVAYAVPLRGYYRHRLSHLSMIIIESGRCLASPLVTKADMGWALAAVYSAYLFALIVTEVLKLPVFFLFWNTVRLELSLPCALVNLVSKDAACRRKSCSLWNVR